MPLSGARGGSISARAEEPPRSQRCPVGAEVDLRSRGGAATRAEIEGQAAEAVGVDLRSRGGAQATAEESAAARGRSPLARRSLSRLRASRASRGSISARAEEPSPGWCGRGRGRVDLRSRGGAVRPPPGAARRLGRSPLARRSLLVPAHRGVENGSISARAEEPRARRGRGQKEGVDLRLRGGAVSHVGIASKGGGSISARAEEPASARCSSGRRGVDLRSRGGARDTFMALGAREG